ncbi:Sister chromatid cohesion protein 2 [Podila epigama]|nr:Sister chromatid cohesion protein 2 [Podila epigama]
MSQQGSSDALDLPLHISRSSSLFSTGRHHDLGDTPAVNNVPPAPSNAQTCLQYNALPSLTSTTSVVRELPSLSVAMPEFRLVQHQSPVAHAILSQEGLHQHTANFEVQLLKTLVMNANVDFLKFPQTAQRAVPPESSTPPTIQELSHLSKIILQHCSTSESLELQSSSVAFQLPHIDPYKTLVQFKQSNLKPRSLVDPQAMIQSLATQAQEQAQEQEQAQAQSSAEPSAATSDKVEVLIPSSSQKRTAAYIMDDERGSNDRAHKRLKSRSPPSSPAVTPVHPSSSLTDPNDSSTDVPLYHRHITPASSEPATPIRPGSHPPTNQETDHVTLFEDRVAEMLESLNDNAPEGSNVLLLRPTEVKNTRLSIITLSKENLLKDVSLDTMASLLKYLDSAIGHFVTVFPMPMADSELESKSLQEQESFIHAGFDKTLLSLDHATLGLAILSSQGLQQHMFPEELLINIMSLIKSIIELFISPALEFSKESGSATKGQTIFKILATTRTLRNRMLTLVGATCEVTESLRNSCSNELSDEIIVKLAYLGLSLFFIDTSSEAMIGLSEAESLRQAGSSLLRTLYSKHLGQHGSKIHASSALLMQLVHTCSENLVIHVLAPDFQELDRQTQIAEMKKLLGDVKLAQESATTSVGFVFNFLLSRSSKGTKSSVDADYRSALESLITDLLNVLGHPEWPSAEMFLVVYSKAIIKYLDDPKADVSSRTLAVESLGFIAAKIKTISNLLIVGSKSLQKESGDELRPFYGDVSIRTTMSELSYLQASYDSLHEYLGGNEANDVALKAAKNAWTCQWGNLLWTASTKETGNSSWGTEQWNFFVSETLKCFDSLKDQQPTIKPKSILSREAVCSRSAYLTSRQHLFMSFDVLLSRILLTLESTLVAVRTKSLKALSLIVTGDYEVLAQQNVRKTISTQLNDPSSAVRDAAIELVGKYMLQDVKILRAYYELVSDRISDKGLNVRKRVIRLLKEIFTQAESVSVRNDVSRKLLLRVGDDETTVRELAIKAVSDIWFSQFLQATLPSSGARGEQTAYSSVSTPVATSSQKREVLKHARKLVEMSGQLSNSQAEAFGSVIECLLKKERGHSAFDISAPEQEFTRTCSVIVGCLVDLIDVLQEENAPKSAVISTVHTLFMFIRAEPQLAAPKHLSALEAYLHSCTTKDDWTVTMYVLRIYEIAIPVVQDVPGAFSHTVEKLVSTLLSSCPVILLPETAHVLCLVSLLLTRQSTRICKLIHNCVQLLNADLVRFQSSSAIQEKKTIRLMMLCGLLVKYFPFERQFAEHPTADHLIELKAKMNPSVQDVVFKALSTFCSEPFPVSLRQTAVRCLGYVYTSHPTLMESSKSESIMKDIFAGTDSTLKTELMHVYNNFLVMIQTTPRQGGVKAGYSLVAKAEDHLEAGIGGALMQKNLDSILGCALLSDPELQSCTVDVLGQVTSQALVHPKLCMPVIVALESSSNEHLNERALSIHKDLHQKHASLIYSSSMECVRTLYSFQKSLAPVSGDTHGYRVVAETGHAVALLGPMYNLLSDKRQTRNAFLASMVKVLDVDLTVPNIEVDGDFCRFVAENLAYLEYRTMEEILLVIYHLNRTIAGAGITLSESWLALSRHRRALGQGDSVKGKQKRRRYASISNGDVSGEDMMVEEDEDREPLLAEHVIARASVPIEAVMVLKSHLKRVYDVSETKCQQFQPTATASHREKPTAKMTGVMARISWKWKSGEVAKICSSHDGIPSKDVVKPQLGRFRQLIEAETIPKSDVHVVDGFSNSHGAAHKVPTQATTRGNHESGGGDKSHERDENEDDEEEEESEESEDSD